MYQFYNKKRIYPVVVQGDYRPDVYRMFPLQFQYVKCNNVNYQLSQFSTQVTTGVVNVPRYNVLMYIYKGDTQSTFGYVFNPSTTNMTITLTAGARFKLMPNGTGTESNIKYYDQFDRLFYTWGTAGNNYTYTVWENFFINPML